MMNFLFLFLFFAYCDVYQGGLKISSIDQQKSQKSTIDKFDNKINFRDRIYLAYKNFLDNSLDESDVDWDYISYKTNLIYEKGIINLTDPFIFGILPDDMVVFLSLRDRLKSLSDVKQALTNLTYQNALADAYVSFDCWIEGVESGTSIKKDGSLILKSKDCRDNLLQKIGIISSLISNTSTVNDLNDDTFKKCETCRLAFMNVNCNAFYFDNGLSLNKQSDYVYRRIKEKISYTADPAITITYYTSPMFVKKYNKDRIKIALNMIGNMFNELKIKKRLNVKIEEKKILTSETNLLFKDAIAVCIRDQAITNNYDDESDGSS